MTFRNADETVAKALLALAAQMRTLLNLIKAPDSAVWFGMSWVREFGRFEAGGRTRVKEGRLATR